MLGDRDARRYCGWIIIAMSMILTIGPAAAYAQDDSSGSGQNFLAYMWVSSPTFFIIMGLISLYLVATVTNLLLKFRLTNVIPSPLVHNLEAMLNEKKFKEAYELIRGDQSLFARALAAGVERLTQGIEKGMDAMITVAEDGKMDMEHKASPIASLGTVAPMIGLLGTVLGMIAAFREIAGSGAQIKPAVIAEKIGLALVTTLEGIVVAVPAIFFFALLRNRIARLVFEVETVCESYIWRFAGALKR